MALSELATWLSDIGKSGHPSSSEWLAFESCVYQLLLCQIPLINRGIILDIKPGQSERLSRGFYLSDYFLCLGGSVLSSQAADHASWK